MVPEVRDTGMVALGSLVGKLCRQQLCGLQVSPANSAQVPQPSSSFGVTKTSPHPHLTLLEFCSLVKPNKEVEHSMETILTGLRSAEKEHEAVTHLLALGNTQLPSTIPTLLEHAEKGPTAVAAAAISSLRQFPAQHITSEVPNIQACLPLGVLATTCMPGPQTASQTAISHQVKRAMRKIFHEKRKSYEKTCRLAAAEILLDNTPLPMDVINILLAAHQLGTEAATFLLLKVQSSLHANHHPAR